MAKSEKRVIVKMRSTAGTGYVYTTRKNKVSDRERLVLRKYDPRIRQHVEFREDR
jgi:large subunit ribosomal protein L33